MSKLFQLKRNIDNSGISGTGIVAEGVVFPNGKVVVCWKGDAGSINNGIKPGTELRGAPEILQRPVRLYKYIL